jgi:para-aminobenzoate synthetase component 1
MDDLATGQTPFLFVLDFALEHPLVVPLDQLAETGIRVSIDPEAYHTPTHRALEVSLTRMPVPPHVYHDGFDQAMAAIRAGDTYLLNLCYSTQVSGVPALDDIFEHARAPYKLYWPGRFVVFSPESFVTLDHDRISTFPMKGTIDASLPDAEAQLLGNVKEQEEHATVVDLLRNDLSMVARDVRVDRYRYISRIEAPDKTLLQCSSAITGHLRPEYLGRPGSILYTLLPAGSVTGAPKKRTVELIRAIEPEPRGFYTGVFGVFDGKVLRSAVMIRMIELRETGYFYRSGGGITYRSDADTEYRELIDKVYVPFS